MRSCIMRSLKGSQLRERESILFTAILNTGWLFFEFLAEIVWQCRHDCGIILLGMEKSRSSLYRARQAAWGRM